MKNLTRAAGHVEGFQITLYADKLGWEAHSRGEGRTGGMLTITTVANKAACGFSGDGVANLPTKAASRDASHDPLPGFRHQNTDHPISQSDVRRLHDGCEDHQGVADNGFSQILVMRAKGSCAAHKPRNMYQT